MPSHFERWLAERQTTRPGNCGGTHGRPPGALSQIKAKVRERSAQAQTDKHNEGVWRNEKSRPGGWPPLDDHEQTAFQDWFAQEERILLRKIEYNLSESVVAHENGDMCTFQKFADQAKVLMAELKSSCSPEHLRNAAWSFHSKAHGDYISDEDGGWPALDSRQIRVFGKWYNKRRAHEEMVLEEAINSELKLLCDAVRDAMQGITVEKSIKVRSLDRAKALQAEMKFLHSEEHLRRSAWQFRRMLNARMRFCIEDSGMDQEEGEEDHEGDEQSVQVAAVSGWPPLCTDQNQFFHSWYGKRYTRELLAAEKALMSLPGEATLASSKGQITECNAIMQHVMDLKEKLKYLGSQDHVIQEAWRFYYEDGIRSLAAKLVERRKDRIECQLRIDERVLEAENLSVSLQLLNLMSLEGGIDTGHSMLQMTLAAWIERSRTHLMRLLGHMKDSSSIYKPASQIESFSSDCMSNLESDAAEQNLAIECTKSEDEISKIPKQCECISKLESNVAERDSAAECMKSEDDIMKLPKQCDQEKIGNSEVTECEAVAGELGTAKPTTINHECISNLESDTADHDSSTECMESEDEIRNLPKHFDQEKIDNSEVTECHVVTAEFGTVKPTINHECTSNLESNAAGHDSSTECVQSEDEIIQLPKQCAQEKIDNSEVTECEAATGELGATRPTINHECTSNVGSFAAEHNSAAECMTSEDEVIKLPKLCDQEKAGNSEATECEAVTGELGTTKPTMNHEHSSNLKSTAAEHDSSSECMKSECEIIKLAKQCRQEKIDNSELTECQVFIAELGTVKPAINHESTSNLESDAAKHDSATECIKPEDEILQLPKQCYQEKIDNSEVTECEAATDEIMKSPKLLDQEKIDNSEVTECQVVTGKMDERGSISCQIVIDRHCTALPKQFDQSQDEGGSPQLTMCQAGEEQQCTKLPRHVNCVHDAARAPQGPPVLVPMGHNCSTATFMQDTKLRKEAYPLDWCCATLKVWDHILRDDFATLLAEPICRGQQRLHPYEFKFQDTAMFLHHPGWHIKNSYTRERMVLRIERLRDILRQRRAFGMAWYCEGFENVHATLEELLDDAKKLALPERGFQHILIVWFNKRTGQPHCPPSWESVSNHLTLLRYTPHRAFEWSQDLHKRDEEHLLQLFKDRFPTVFIQGASDKTIQQSESTLSDEEKDGDTWAGTEIDWYDEWDFENGYRRLCISPW